MNNIVFSPEATQTTNRLVTDVRKLQHDLTGYIGGLELLQENPEVFPEFVREFAYQLHFQADSFFQHATRLKTERDQSP